MAGVFNTTIGELHEMLYQNNHPYIFDSTKFNDYFNYQPGTYEKGIEATIAAAK